MKPTLIIGTATIYLGSNLDVLPELQSNSVDSIVCDPPYELGFMGKSWDSSGIAYNVQLWEQCLRVLKPGGHLLAFGGTRTFHRMAVAIEDAGFEIRDNIAWLYGSGFPKSHNISKAIDKAAGAERTVVGQSNAVGIKSITKARVEQGYRKNLTVANERESIEITVSATDEAKAWDGWGTALKPAHEPIIVARKPVIGTIAENVLQYGTGALNIDATRIAGQVPSVPMAEWTTSGTTGASAKRSGEMSQPSMLGRWPANIILDEYTAQILDEQSGISKSGKSGIRRSDGFNANTYGSGIGKKAGQSNGEYGDSGGASRFFYVAKANKRDRNEGLDELPEVRGGTERMNNSDGRKIEIGEDNRLPKSQNFHPTVKPTALMQYLIRLVTPENGLVLDPFAGSGSTGKAAILENKRFIGIELTAEYLPIIEGRLKHAYKTLDDKEADLFE